MSPFLLLVVLVEAACVVLVWRAARATGGGALGAMFVAAAFVYYGLSDIASALIGSSPAHSSAQLLVPSQAMVQWRWLAMFAVIVFSLTYAAAARVLRQGSDHSVTPTPGLTRFSWKAIAIVAVPLWLVALNQDPRAATPGDYWKAGIANQFLIVLIILAVVDYSLRKGGATRSVVTALAVACLMTLLIGQRLEVLGVVTLSLGSLWWYGVRLPRRVFFAGGVAVLLLTATMTIAREEVGRAHLSQGAPLPERVSALAGAITGLSNPAKVRPVTAEFIGRFDGNGFPALVLDAQDKTSWRPGLDGMRIGWYLTVPRFLNPVKTSSSVEQRSEKEMLNKGYSLGIRQDFLPTVFGSAVAQTGPASLVLVVVLLAVLLALVDRWLAGPRTDFHLVIGLGMGLAIMYFERNLGDWLVVLRGVVPLLIIVAVVSLAQRVALRDRSVAQHPCPSVPSVATRR